jgi:hypothetical protein
MTGRWHDNRHTLIRDLAESGAGDQTIMDIAGHVSKRMLRHYSHIRMKAKRTALESIVKNQTSGVADQAEDSRSIDGPRVWGTHIEHTVREVDAGRRRSPKWIAQNQSQLCLVLMWGTHKSPHNRLFLKFVEERYGLVSQEKIWLLR